MSLPLKCWNYIPHPLYPVHDVLGSEPRALSMLVKSSANCIIRSQAHHSILRGSLLTIPQTPREPHRDTGWLGKGTWCCLPCAVLASRLGRIPPASPTPSEAYRLCQYSSAVARECPSQTRPCYSGPSRDRKGTKRAEPTLSSQLTKMFSFIFKLEEKNLSQID